MSLKPVIDSLDQVLPDLRQHYISDGDTFVLQMDGDPHGFVSRSTHADSVNKIAEFRDNNIELEQALVKSTSALKRFESIDPDAARNALAQVQELGKKGIRKSADVDSAVASALQNFKATELEPLRKLLTEEREAREQADHQVAQAALKSAVLTAFRAAGGQDAALDYIVNRATDVFQVDGDKLVAKPGMYSTDTPGDPLGLPEWMATQTKDVGFAFGASNGAGARHGDGLGTTVAPGVRILRNPTPLELGSNAKDIRSGRAVIMND
jgi:hypothetical protein